MNTFERIAYLSWAAGQCLTADCSCPACGASETSLIKRKAFVTSLYECTLCGLMFRVPKDSASRAEAFYQRRYRQGFTTDVPSESELSRLMQRGFTGTEKDYTAYMNVLEAAGLRSGDVVVDFGATWGYGSWQLARAGYRVYSYEISVPRARYAAEKLGCQMLADPRQVPEKADCFFSAHVIEHLPNPMVLWETACAVLKPGGTIVLFTPNGERSTERARPKQYHQLWGKVHPLLLTARALSAMAGQFGFIGCGYSSPYELPAIQRVEPGNLEGNELLFIARRGPQTKRKQA